METSRTEVEHAILAAVNAVSSQKLQFLDKAAPIERVGLDSIALSQVILHIESRFACEMPEQVLVRIGDVETVGEFIDLLGDFYARSVGSP
jgi:acyl carrier protein